MLIFARFMESVLASAMDTPLAPASTARSVSFFVEHKSGIKDAISIGQGTVHLAARLAI
jgi:hypothetical protein